MGSSIVNPTPNPYPLQTFVLSKQNAQPVLGSQGDPARGGIYGPYPLKALGFEYLGVRNPNQNANPSGVNLFDKSTAGTSAGTPGTAVATGAPVLVDPFEWAIGAIGSIGSATSFANGWTSIAGNIASKLIFTSEAFAATLGASELWAAVEVLFTVQGGAAPTIAQQESFLSGAATGLQGPFAPANPIGLGNLALVILQIGHTPITGSGATVKETTTGKTLQLLGFALDNSNPGGGVEPSEVSVWAMFGAVPGMQFTVNFPSLVASMNVQYVEVLGAGVATVKTVRVGTAIPQYPTNQDDPFIDGEALQQVGNWFTYKDVNENWFFGTGDCGVSNAQIIFSVLTDPCRRMFSFKSS